MKPTSLSDLHRLQVGGEIFLCARRPDCKRPVEVVLAEALARQSPRQPALIYWDALVEPSAGETWVRFGQGGLDPILASERDLSRCVAIGERAFERLKSRGAIEGESDFARAIALLARAPGTESMWCPELAGAVDPLSRGALASSGRPAAHAESISLCVLAPEPGLAIEPFFTALRGQAVTGRIDLIVLTLGFDSSDLKDLVRKVESAVAADSRLRLRRYSLSGALGPAYLANVAVALASHEAVVLADVRCVPISSGTIQRMADWVLSSDISSATPRIIHGDQLISAGLSFARREDAEVLTPCADPLFSDDLRTIAAPSPWFLSVRRTPWLAAGGMRGVSDAALWSAEFAAARGPRGRSLLVGSELVEWTGAERPAQPTASTSAHDRPQPFAAAALRDPRILNQVAAVRPALVQDNGGNCQDGFSDVFPCGATTRILVFADAFGASQAIPFVHGLASARAGGDVAVRVVTESAFAGDSRALDEVDATDQVGAQFREVQPTMVVASRLGHASVWRAARAAAETAGLPMVCHMDDDILNLPVVLGIERYRLARNPKRQQTLQAALAEADLVLATTPALAERLSLDAGHDRFVALRAGAGGDPSPVAHASRQTQGLTIGYMGSASHDHDLAMIAPALNAVQQRYPFVKFVLFGSIAEQPARKLLTGNIERHPAVSGDYSAFRRRLAELQLDIGLAPLTNIAFNRSKTPVKWVEYAGAGAAVVASNIDPYVPIIEAGAALGVRPDGWEIALRRLIESPELRVQLMRRADALLREDFSWNRLETEMMSVLAMVSERGRRVT